MTDRELSAGDAALRLRLTELCVHIPCGGVRGPNREYRRWQSCRCEDTPEVWEGYDVSRSADLCIICFRGTAGGSSRWAWLACGDCKAINDAIGSRWGRRPFALGRHSIMNGVALRGGQSKAITEQQIAALAAFARGDDGLRAWRREEYRRLASAFDPQADVPLKQWQATWPPGPEASVDAFTRLLSPQP